MFFPLETCMDQRPQIKHVTAIIDKKKVTKILITSGDEAYASCISVWTVWTCGGFARGTIYINHLLSSLHQIGEKNKKRECPQYNHRVRAHKEIESLDRERAGFIEKR